MFRNPELAFSRLDVLHKPWRGVVCYSVVEVVLQSSRQRSAYVLESVGSDFGDRPGALEPNYVSLVHVGFKM